jgi:toxin ParE1/3/4
MLLNVLAGSMIEGERFVIRSHEADNDLVSIWLYRADEWSPEQADKHLLEIEVVCNRLLDDPELGKPRDDLIAGMRSTFVRPHVVFYRFLKNNIEIVRVLHQREDASTLFSGN